MKSTKKGGKNRYFHYQKEILNTISEPATFINKSFHYVFVNSAFNKFYGIETNHIIGKAVDELWDKSIFESKIKPSMLKCLGGEEVFIKYEGNIPNNGFRVLKMNFYPHFKTPKRIDGIIHTSTDITEQTQAEQKIIKNEARLKNLNATKDKLFSIIGHDLKGPLNNILGFSELIEEAYDSFTDEEIRRYNKLIHESSKTLSELLDNLLTWSRSQQQTIKVNPETFPLYGVVDECHNLLRQNAFIKNIQIINQVPPDMLVTADIGMITTVIRNLVSNAVKFTPKDGSITISASSEGKKVTIRIRDTGIGISEEKIPLLFQPGTSQSLGTDGERGTGLGLLICKDFVEKNNGEIWVESEPEIGSSFCFSMNAG